MNDADNINYHEVQVWMQAWKLAFELGGEYNAPPRTANAIATEALNSFRKDFNIKGETNND